MANWWARLSTWPFSKYAQGLMERLARNLYFHRPDLAPHFGKDRRFPGGFVLLLSAGSFLNLFLILSLSRNFCGAQSTPPLGRRPRSRQNTAGRLAESPKPGCRKFPGREHKRFPPLRQKTWRRVPPIYPSRPFGNFLCPPPLRSEGGARGGFGESATAFG